MGSRQEAIMKIVDKKEPPPCKGMHRPLQEVFGEYTFHEKEQKKRLSEEVFKALQETIKEGKELSTNIAEAVALAMKEWALEKKATHFCHWFQPLTELTAEKHDSFFSVSQIGEVIPEFSGKELIRGEPDASSFPSGGLRTTFEARGYTAWDPSSPAFILEHGSGKTLVIPTMFLSWRGDALDKKTPLLRSMQALSKPALRILHLFGNTSAKRVITTLGTEQEYFLVDRHFFVQRPDFINCGRLLFGAKSPKGQELEDHYLGTIPERVLSLISELEYELARLGVPVETRHNEVAPAQYELALVYQRANLAADHQMLVMEMLKKVALRHGMNTLLHEKPYAGINGSGKHLNWSLATDNGTNLLEPGDTPHENAQFLVFLAAVVRAVHKYGSLLRMSIASATNDHRLGLHEAPPGIMSVFLGDQLSQIFHSLLGREGKFPQAEKELEIGVTMLPKIPRHLSDRNRTSPFAFTGNKFEFRAVGSSQNIARPASILNTIVVESLDFCADRLEKALQTNEDLNRATQDLLKEIAQEVEPTLFEGDNYDDSWHREAVARGLKNITNAVDAVLLYTHQETIDLFTKYQVLSERELKARQGIHLSNYMKRVLIEADTASMIGHTLLLPAAIRYQVEVGRAEKYGMKGNLSKTFSSLTENFKNALAKLDHAREKIPDKSPEERAVYIRDKVLRALMVLRSHGDALERNIADELWPLPKYHEMLFIR